MPAYNLTATAPETRLLAAIDRLLRTGVPGISASQPPTIWAAGAPCPSGHSVFPTGLRIYRHDIPEEVDSTAPAIVLYIEEQPQRCVDSWEGLWRIAVKVDLIWDRDLWDTAEGEAIVGFVKNLLTNDIQTPADGISRACTRLTDSTFLAVGTIEENNFAEGVVDRLQTNEGHPYISIGFRLTCGGLNA